MGEVKKARKVYLGGYRAKAPRYATEYFESYYGGGGTLFREHPTIHSTFTPGVGWRAYPIRKTISGNMVRKLRAEGVTHIALKAYGRVADFSVKELSKR